MIYIALLAGLLMGFLLRKICIFLINERVESPIEKYYLNGKYAWILWGIVTAVGFLLMELISGSYLKTIELMILFSIFLLIICIDYTIKKIPNQLLLSLMITRLLFLSLNFNGEEFMPSIIGLFVGYLVFALPSNFKVNVGMGDIKLGAVAGFYLGVNGFFQAMIIMALLVGLLYIFLKVKKMGNLKTSTPLGPHISIGMLLTILFPLI